MDRAAGHKGFGLAVCAGLFGGIVGRGTVNGQDGPEWVNNAGMFILIDPLCFSSRAEVEGTVASVHDYVKSASYPSAIQIGVATANRAFLPGEPEHRTLIRREKEGILITNRTLVALSELTASLDVELQAL